MSTLENGMMWNTPCPSRRLTDRTEVTFYGTSFVAGPTGEILTDADRTSQTHITGAQAC